LGLEPVCRSWRASRYAANGETDLLIQSGTYQEYKLDYEVLHSSSQTRSDAVGQVMRVETTTSARPVVIQVSTKKVVSTVVEE
jgi:hypothetical protein